MVRGFAKEEQMRGSVMAAHKAHNLEYQFNSGERNQMCCFQDSATL